MEDNKKIKVALFYAGSHLEEKIIVAKNNDENYDEYVNLIGCSDFDSLYCKPIKIGDKEYVVFYDGTKKGKKPFSYYKPDSVLSVITDNYEDVLYGNVVISNEDKNGFCSLTKEDFENIQKHIGCMLGEAVTGPILFPAIKTALRH